MSLPEVSVIIPTHNRHEKVCGLVADLRGQDVPPSRYEVVVVDDGSTPPVVLPEADDGSTCSLIRLGGGERSAARNAGASVAKGRLLVFLDDDMSVGPSFLTAYIRASQERRDTLLVGDSVLPTESRQTSFGRFRERLERSGLPVGPDAPAPPNFCAAGNMAIPADLFRRLNGFDRTIASGEDQDLALRHSALGGRIAFVPEARSLHRDGALDIRGYCGRVLWGSEFIIPFCQRYPEWPANVERERVNGFFERRRAPLSDAVRKLAKSALAVRPLTNGLFRCADMLERVAPGSSGLEKLYGLLIGIHFFRGYRDGLRRFGGVTPPGEPARASRAPEHATP
jgi:glycosyltransferase involved in cell wall biosynthesis